MSTLRHFGHSMATNYKFLIEINGRERKRMEMIIVLKNFRVENIESDVRCLNSSNVDFFVVSE